MNQKSPEWFVKADNRLVQIYKVISYIALICLVAIMLIAVVDVIGEKSIKVSVPYYSDWIAYLHVPIVFFSAGFITLERGHTCVDILTNHLPAIVRKITEYFSMLMGIVICAFLSWRGIFFLLPDIYTHHTTISTSSYAFPQWPFTAAYCVGLVMLTFSFVWALLRLIFNYVPPEVVDRMTQPDDDAEEGAEA